MSIEWLIKRLDKMQDEIVRELFLPKMQVYIVEALKGGPKTQQEIAQKLPRFFDNPLTCIAFYKAWEGYEKAGVIKPISHGRGHPRTWQLTILKEVTAEK